MSDDDQTKKSIEELKTEVVSLKIRLRRVEDYLHNIPDASDYLAEDTDEMFERAVRLVVEHDKASASLLQRSLAIGYARAARLIDILEDKGVIGPQEGSLPREVLVRDAEAFLARQDKRLGTISLNSVSLNGEDGLDVLFRSAVSIVCETGTASADLLQRRLSIGYARAARLMDQLEQTGVIGPINGLEPREVSVRDAEAFLSQLAEAQEG